jgi:HlyD family secretion protein
MTAQNRPIPFLEHEKMAKIQDTSATDVMITRRGPKRTTVMAGIVAGVLIVATVLAWPSIKRWSGSERSFDRSRLRFAQVTRGTLVRDLAVSGRIVASSYPTLYSPAQGTVTLDVRAGDTVVRGQLLARVDSPELDGILAQQVSQVEALEADLDGQRITNQTTVLTNQQDVDLKLLKQETAQREMDRSDTARADGLINEIEYAKAKDALAIATLEYKHGVQNAQLQRKTLDHTIRNVEKQLERERLILDEARRQVRELDVLSPVDGVVGSVSINPEDNVTPNQQLMTVIDLSAFEIEIDIPENYADDISIGAEAEIDYEGRIYGGVVSSVSPEVSGSLVEGRVVFGDELPQGLKQNQRVNTRIILSSKENVLKARRGPYLEAGGGREIYRVEGDLATQLSVTVGVTSITEVEILSGLDEGDTIVISDTSRFQDAKSILLRN